MVAVAVLLIGMALSWTRPLYASDTTHSSTDGGVREEISLDERVANDVENDHHTTQAENSVSINLANHPPLPFQSPQVGPLIKRFYTSDVDRWTTAFIPQSPADLNMLTPIVMPSGEAHWIRVDLSEQMAVAYEGMRPVRAFIISSGLSGTPTVTGRFRIRIKVPSQTMSGGSGSLYYYLPNVKWVQYFFEEYGFHGTYWHNDFGRPHSHGCINMTNADAKWLFDWAGPEWDGSKWQKISEADQGTLVIVHD